MPRRKRGRRAHGEGSVFFRADRTRWMVRLPGASTLRSFKTEKEALDHLITARLEQKNGQLPRPSAYTMESWLAEWLATRTVRQNLAPASVMRYQRSITRITPVLGTVKLKDLEPRHVERLLKVLAEEETAATVRMVFEDLRCALRSARKLKLIAREPTADVEPPKRLQANGASCSLTDEQARDLMLAAERDEEYGALWMLALSAGLRRGELLALRWSAIDLTTAIARIEIGVQRATATKGWRIGPLKTAGSRRETALIPQVVDALRGHQRRQKETCLKTGRPWDANGFVFQSGDGNFLRPETLFYRHAQLIKIHKLAPHRFHDLRHTCATLLIKHGESIPAVSRQLGHSSSRMTLERYAHVLPDQRQSVASRMSKLLAG